MRGSCNKLFFTNLSFGFDDASAISSFFILKSRDEQKFAKTAE